MDPNAQDAPGVARSPGQAVAPSPDGESDPPPSDPPPSPAPSSEGQESARLPTATSERLPAQPALEVELSRRRPTQSRPDEPAGEEGEEPEALAPGSTFAVTSHMELTCLRELGRGGMGVVYLVRDPLLGRLAALKLLRLRPTPTRLARFRREAAITAHLDHPGIPPVYEAGRTATGRDYLLLRYVEGRSMAEALDRLEERRMRARQRGQSAEPSPRDLLEALARVGEALAYAHARGIVHRDLKPGNVMLGHFGEVLVMDWGLARDLRESEQADTTFRAQLDKLAVDTRDGAFLGTLGYMAPEQARGEEVDARADVFALGALLCEVLTGSSPFEGETTSEVLENTRAGRVRRPLQLDPHVSPELDAIAARALDPAREQRYASAADFARDLKAWLEGRRVSVYRYSTAARVARWIRRHSTFSVAMVLVLFAALLAVQAGRAERDQSIAAARYAYTHRVTELTRRPPQSLDDHLERAWSALQAARTWRQLDPDGKEAAHAVYQSALALGDVALEARQWTLAKQAYLQALRQGGDEDRVNELVRRVEAAKSAEAERRRATLRQVLEQVETGKRTHPDDLRDAVLEIVHQAEPIETTPELAARLTAIAAALRKVERDLLLSAVVPDREERARGEQVIEGLEAALDASGDRTLGEEPWRDHRRRIQAAIARIEARARREFRPPGSESFLAVLAARQRQALGPGQLQLAWVLAEVLGRLSRRDVAVEALAEFLSAAAEPGPAASAVRALERLGEGPLALSIARRRFGAIPRIDAWPERIREVEHGPSEKAD